MCEHNEIDLDCADCRNTFRSSFDHLRKLKIKSPNCKYALPLLSGKNQCCNQSLPLGKSIVCDADGCNPSCKGYKLTGEEEETYMMKGIFPGCGRLKFNPTIIQSSDGYWMAYRDDINASSIWLGKLNKYFQPIGNAVKLNLLHQEATWQEDPRLFYHNNKLHISYIGIVVGLHGIKTNVLYAELDGTDVVKIFSPHYKKRNHFEKNWIFFSHEQQLYAIYSISPHRILKVNGEECELVFDNPVGARWSSGECRGGSTPVLVDDEYWCFFHSSVHAPRATRPQHRKYDMGVYTFEAKPPFRITRLSAEPILYANEGTRPHDVDKSVIFPCGAVFNDDFFTVSCGIHDRWSEFHHFNIDELKSKLTRLMPPSWWNTSNSWDEEVWNSVASHDEYKIEKLDLQGKSVLDIGAHIGTFSFKASEQGASVDCYEPESESFDLLTKNMERLNGVNCYQEAIGDHIGCWFRSNKAVTEEIKTLSLDRAILRLAERSKDGRVNLLKIDCERGEWPAFSNATRLDLVDTIVGEWHHAHWQNREWTAEDLHQLLYPAGFDVFFGASHQSAGLFSAERKSNRPIPVKLPHVYVVCCDELIEKKERVSKYLTSEGISFTLYKSFHGDTFGIKRTEKTGQAGIGCSLGHYSLWQHLWLSGVEEAIIVEDDFKFVGDYKQQFVKVRKNLPKNWQIVLLGVLENDALVEKKTLTKYPGGLIRMREPFGLHCYLIKRSALPILMAQCKTVEVPMDIAVYLNVFEPNLVEWFVCHPTLAIQE